MRANVALTAWVPATAASDVVVYGTTNAPSDVTVRAIYVAAQPVTRGSFNFRTWSADVPLAVLTALARGGAARIPVVAYTSAGCQSLPLDGEPLVLFDGGVSPPPQDDASADRLPADGAPD